MLSNLSVKHLRAFVALATHRNFTRAAQACHLSQSAFSTLVQTLEEQAGSRLFERAVVSARNEGVRLLFIHALSENTAMLKIARHAGAPVERSGSESEAFLKLPEATFDSRMNEIALDHFAQVDYQIKARAKQFWSFLAGLQEVRSGVRDARDRTSP